MCKFPVSIKGGDGKSRAADEGGILAPDGPDPAGHGPPLAHEMALA